MQDGSKFQHGGKQTEVRGQVQALEPVVYTFACAVIETRPLPTRSTRFASGKALYHGICIDRGCILYSGNLCHTPASRHSITVFVLIGGAYCMRVICAIWR